MLLSINIKQHLIKFVIFLMLKTLGEKLGLKQEFVKLIKESSKDSQHHLTGGKPE